MKKVYLIASAIILSLASCSEEDAINGRGSTEDLQTMTFTASYSGEQPTRATLNGTSETFDAGDAISIFSARNANVKFVTTSGGKSVTFTGNALSDNRYYAVYPYTNTLTLSADGSTISGATIPTTQWNSCWAEGNKSGWDTSAPLAYAVASTNNSLVFTNTCAILKITISAYDNDVAITIGADQMLAGPCTITNGVLTIDAAKGSNVVTVGNDNYKVKGGSIVYVAIAPGTYTNFYVSAHNGSKENRKNKANITFAPNVIHNLGSFAIESVPIHGNHDYVDLGLPSGTLWATCNVGANSPEEYGDYFAWGETETKDVYDWSTYKWCNGTSTSLTKYCTNSDYGIVDNKSVLDLEDDAAYVNWGADWRMPTIDELSELEDTSYCSWTWITLNGVFGFKVTSKSNGNYIFLPATDHYDGTSITLGEYGAYLSASSETATRNYRAQILSFGSKGSDTGLSGWSETNRCLGYTIRPVRRKFPVREYVDLGLPSGTLWATCNVGANSPEEYGDYFAWGETETKDVYDWSTYEWCRGNNASFTKYCINTSCGILDNKTVLDLEDDAAYVNWGSDWCMPTFDELSELSNSNNCTWISTTLNGIYGFLVTSKTNGNSIFFPASGYRNNSLICDIGSNVCFWTSSLYSYYECTLSIGFVSKGSEWLGGRFLGFTIRPVRRKFPVREYVDLGLPSGTLWATCNVGANSPVEYGDYFAWGETEPKTNYGWSTYKWCNGSYDTMTKYNTDSFYGIVDNKTVLDIEDDAAYVI